MIYGFIQKIFTGCHVLLKNSNNELLENIPYNILYKCAEFAKNNSKGKFSSNVPIDYCYAKYVKKPSNGKPGFVIYTHNKTIYVK